MTLTDTDLPALLDAFLDADRAWERSCDHYEDGDDALRLRAEALRHLIVTHPAASAEACAIQLAVLWREELPMLDGETARIGHRVLDRALPLLRGAEVRAC